MLKTPFTAFWYLLPATTTSKDTQTTESQQSGITPANCPMRSSLGLPPNTGFAQNSVFRGVMARIAE